jgi:hypothetical protein
MNIFRELASGITIAIISIIMIASAFSLSFAESNPITLISATQQPTTKPPVNVTQEIHLSANPTSEIIQATPTKSPTSLPSPTACPPPEGWMPYTVRSGDSIETLSQAFSIAGEQLRTANCLISNSLIENSIIYIPQAALISPTAELPPTTVPCGLPTGWEEYVVQPNDTIRDLPIIFGVSRSELLAVNCLDYGAVIHVGDVIHVPSEPIFTQHTPTPTPTITESIPAALPKETGTPIATSSVTP